MARILGIDTSNYTTSIAVVEDGNLIYDRRKLLEVKRGERGLRQSEALFQHIRNIPLLLEDDRIHSIDGITVSEKPRPVEDSYMPVFKAGEHFAESISKLMNIPIYRTTHQEGHIEAACQSINFHQKEFIAIHMSGGTSEILYVEKKEKYNIEKIGGTRDISIGQLLDRVGVMLGFGFPAGRYIDELALKMNDPGVRIPSKVDGMYFNLSGQETMTSRLIDKGHNREEISYILMLCICKTLEKVLNEVKIKNNKSVLITGGVASSSFLRTYLNDKFKNVYFSDSKYASDNAVGVAYIGYNKYLECDGNGN